VAAAVSWSLCPRAATLISGVVGASGVYEYSILRPAGLSSSWFLYTALLAILFLRVQTPSFGCFLGSRRRERGTAAPIPLRHKRGEQGTRAAARERMQLRRILPRAAAIHPV